MSTRNVNYYLIKTARLSGWLLFALVLLYIVTGFALCGEYGMSRWIDVRTALAIHKVFEWPLVVIFATHSLVTIYFALRRWGWIGKRAKAKHNRRPATLPPDREPRETHAVNS